MRAKQEVSKVYMCDSLVAKKIFDKYRPLIYAAGFYDYAGVYFLLQKDDAIRFIKEDSNLFIGFEGADVSEGVPCSLLHYIFGISDDMSINREFFYGIGEAVHLPEIGEKYADLFFSARTRHEGAVQVAIAAIEDAPSNIWFSITLD